MGVVAVGALALGVSALAAPRPVDDSAVRGTNKGKTEVTRLVTGDPAQINAVVAGTPPTAIIAISPVPTKNAPYPAGTTITADPACGGGLCRLNADEGNFRAYFDVTIRDWNPGGDKYCSFALPPYTNFVVCTGTGQGTCPAGETCEDYPGMHSLLIKVDANGYKGTNAVPPAPAIPGTNLVPPASIPCGSAADCVALFGESWAQCVLGFCKAGYMDIPGFLVPDAKNNFCDADVGGGCASGTTDTSSDFYRWITVHNLNNRPDAHVTYYVGSLVLDIPSGKCSVTATQECGTLPGLLPCPLGEVCTPLTVKGKYAVAVHTDTVIADVNGTEFDTLREDGFIVNIRTGSCCYALGTPLSGCKDGATKAECELEAAPRVWTENKLCSAGCVECLIGGRNTDPLCNDGDSCTDDVCTVPPGLCSHPSIAGFDPIKPDGTLCCDGSGIVPDSAVLTTKDDGDACTCDRCSIEEGNRGTALHIPCVASCDDGGFCTAFDICDGVNTEENGGCSGTDINTIDCLVDEDCPPGFLCGTREANKCDCNPIPNVQFVLSPSAPKTCVGGFRDGLPCAVDADCTGFGFCNNFADGANCFYEGEKITALVHIGSAGGLINGGELLMSYDPGCVDYVSATCLAPYTTTVYGPIVNEAAGTIFIICGVDPFGGVNGPLGNVDMVRLSFTKIGECNNCELCFADSNPRHSYLVNDEGQAINIAGKCKELSAFGELVLDVPDNIKTNVDCDKPTAVVTWAAPAATFSCGDVNLLCRGAREDGGSATYLAMGGGVFPQGATSFCCYAWAKDKCGQTAGCPGAANDCPGDPKPTGCWTVQVNDETSMDIDIGLEPPITSSNADGTLTRCIEFCLYPNCLEEPLCFENDVTFGGLFNFVGKSQGKVKIPGKGQWDCITAQDQLHSLRSCCRADSNPPCLYCDGSQLVADFTGDPELGGNWLIGGNLDAYKKDEPKASHNIIDVLDFGMFTWQYGVCYADKSPGCHDGPHADINGDGCVTAADYQFIIRNFLASSKDCCCVGDGASVPTPLAEVSVDELRQMGMGELAVADLNGDGLVNAQDMDAFTQGARPTKTSNDRKGGKGLRSGR
jgi:hypothetical protein